MQEIADREEQLIVPTDSRRGDDDIQQQTREDDRQGPQQVEGLPLAVWHAGTYLQQAVQAGDGRQELFQQK